MDIQGWDERYRGLLNPKGASVGLPANLVVKTAQELSPGNALDLACGSGRNALWLAKQGWKVTAIDGASTAIQLLRRTAEQENLPINGRVADLQSAGFSLPESGWELVVICYYLQRDLFEKAKASVKAGGVLLVIVHVTEGDEEPTASRLKPGELVSFFSGWTILHSYEGKPDDPEHRRSVSEVVARKPA